MRSVSLGLEIRLDGYIARPNGDVDFLFMPMVNELYIGIVPTLLGEGIPLFPSGFPQREFGLVENKTYSRGMIALKYRRASEKPKKKS